MTIRNAVRRKEKAENIVKYYGCRESQAETRKACKIHGFAKDQRLEKFVKCIPFEIENKN